MKNSHIAFIMFICLAAPLIAESQYYDVEKNDTLWSISRNFNVDIDQLRAANQIGDERSLRVGMRLLIPSVYQVEKGDTLWGIARSHQTSVQVLRELNNLDDNGLDIGDVLLVPALSGIAEGTGDVAATESVAAARPVESTIAAITDPSATPFWPHDGDRTNRTGKLSGTEFLGSLGDDVVTISSGEVVWQARHNLVYGNLIIIESADSHLYLYAGLSETMVTLGERVRAGMRIAKLGVDSLTGEAKLLLSVYKNGKAIDPSVAPRG